MSVVDGVGVCVGVSELEVESVGVVVLLAAAEELVDLVGVVVGVLDEETAFVDVLFSVADAEDDVVVAAPEVNPPARSPTAEVSPLSRSFFSTTSRRTGFELNQLAWASARKTVIRVKTRKCCRENILAMVLCV